MKTYHTIKTLALGGIAMFSLASCSLDYEPLSEPPLHDSSGAAFLSADGEASA